MGFANPWEAALAAAAAVDDRLVVMTAENRATIPSLPRVLGRRFIDVGIAEQTLVGAAAGLALRGRRPVIHALAAFLTMRAFEFVRTDLGVAGLPVVLVGFVPGLLSEANGPTHQALEDVALMRGIPGMRVFCPRDAEELAEALPRILEDPHPWYVRYCGLSEPDAGPRTPFLPGRAEWLAQAEGGVALLSYGFLVREAVVARHLLEARGVPVTLLHLRSLAPVDEAALDAAVGSAHLVVTLEDHFRRGGLHAIVLERIHATRSTARLLPLDLDDRWFRPGKLADVLRHERLSGSLVASRILEGL
jgi:transketolase